MHTPAGAPRARRIELAHENFTRARELRPDGVTNCYRHAMLYLQIQNNPKPALHLLNQAVDFVHELLARTCLAQGRIDQARDTIDQVPVKMRRPYFRWTEADVLCAAGRFDRAVQVLTETADRDSRSRHIALLRLTKICYSQGQFEAGADHAGRAVDFFREKWGNPYYAGLFWQALCAFKAGRRQQADTLVTELERECPHFPKLDRLAAMIRG